MKALTHDFSRKGSSDGRPCPSASAAPGPALVPVQTIPWSRRQAKGGRVWQRYRREEALQSNTSVALLPLYCWNWRRFICQDCSSRVIYPRRQVLQCALVQRVYQQCCSRIHLRCATDRLRHQFCSFSWNFLSKDIWVLRTERYCVSNTPRFVSHLPCA